MHLELGEACQRKRRGSPLAWSRGRVDSRFPVTSGGREGLDSVPYQDGVRPHEPTVQAHQNRAALSADGARVLVASPLELGLYALLGVLGLAAAVMVAGCTVLAVKYQKQAVSGRCFLRGALLLVTFQSGPLEVYKLTAETILHSSNSHKRIFGGQSIVCLPL